MCKKLTAMLSPVDNVMITESKKSQASSAPYKL